MSKIRHLFEQEKEAKGKIEDLEALCICQEDRTRELQIENMDLEEVLKAHDELIKELGVQLGLGDDDDDKDAADDVDNGDPGDDDAAAEENVDDVAHGDVAEAEDVEDPKMLIPKQKEPEEMKVLGPEEEPEPPS
jgi:hypothetical protein